MKIKIIDLLNKIANGEEVPEKVIFDGYIFEKDLETDYTCFVKSGGVKYLLNEVFLSQLNDEIEIIEEPKKIEKINRNRYPGTDIDPLDDILDKLDELIDVVNELKRDK